MANLSDSIDARLKAVAEKYAPIKAEINATGQFISEELAKAEVSVEVIRSRLAWVMLARIELAAAEKMEMAEILGNAGFVVFKGGQA